MNLTKKLSLVYKVIQDNPGVQNDEAALITAVWRYEGWSDLMSLEENIRRVTRPETISRRRRELHNLGLIEYSKQADKTRKQAFEKERDGNSSYDFAKVKALEPKNYKQVNIFSLENK